MRKAGAWLGPLMALAVAAPSAQALSIGAVTTEVSPRMPDVTVTYTGRSGAEQLTIIRDATTVTFRVTGGLIFNNGDGCTGGGLSVTCSAAAVGADTMGVSVDAGPGDDQLDAGGSVVGMGLRGGPGRDTLLGSSGGDFLQAGDGNDVLRGREGGDWVEGGAGDDDIGGGPGEDEVHYEDRAAPVRVTLDGLPGDGPAQERDFIRGDVEDVRGSRGGGDLVIGDAGPNRISLSIAGAADSTVRSGAGDDWLWGAGDFDGGAGNDQLYFPFANPSGRMQGGTGDDYLWTDNGVTELQVDCGDGTDTVIVDPGDPRTQCEVVTEH
jgi:Ca2+-binding RTX toxin-like protein